MGFQDLLAIFWGEGGGKIKEGGVILIPNELVFSLLLFLRLCQFWWKSINKCDCESAHGHTHWQTQTDFIICAMQKSMGQIKYFGICPFICTDVSSRITCFVESTSVAATSLSVAGLQRSWQQLADNVRVPNKLIRKRPFGLLFHFKTDQSINPGVVALKAATNRSLVQGLYQQIVPTRRENQAPPILCSFALTSQRQVFHNTQQLVTPIAVSCSLTLSTQYGNSLSLFQYATMSRDAISIIYSMWSDLAKCVFLVRVIINQLVSVLRGGCNCFTPVTAAST